MLLQAPGITLTDTCVDFLTWTRASIRLWPDAYTVQPRLYGRSHTSPEAAGISRWLALEIINPPRKKGYRSPSATTQPGIFAFTMLGIGVFTGERTFGEARSETRGRIPEKPRDAESRGLTIGVWKLIQRCWHQNPIKRSDSDTVVNA